MDNKNENYNPKTTQKANPKTGKFKSFCIIIFLHNKTFFDVLLNQSKTKQTKKNYK